MVNDNHKEALVICYLIIGYNFFLEIVTEGSFHWLQSPISDSSTIFKPEKHSPNDSFNFYL